MRALLLACSVLLGGCWNWSFPEELLKEDSRPPEARVDTTGDVSHDTEPPDDGPRPEGLPDATPDLTFDTVPQCDPACVPTSTTPICEGGTCRGCQTNGECQGISTGELCAADGSCPAQSSIAYVDKAAGNCSASHGSKATPYCTIKEALVTTKKYVLVRPGSYIDDLTFDDVIFEVYGEPGATIDLAACEKLAVKGTSNLRLQGLQIKSSPTAKDTSKAMILLSETAKLTVAQSQIGPSGCIGIKSAAGNTVTLQRNLVLKNPGGGMDLDGTYQVENNIIVQNSETSVNYGGAKLDPASVATSAFINNTVADNSCKGSNDSEACGVRCEADKTKLVNNIFWGNTFNSTGDTQTDRQYSTKCTADFSFEELKPGATPTKSNITFSAPGFVGPTPSTSADAYHITPASKAAGKGSPTGAPDDDYDGQPRDPNNPDIGADEL